MPPMIWFILLQVVSVVFARRAVIAIRDSIDLEADQVSEEQHKRADQVASARTSQNASLKIALDGTTVIGGRYRIMSKLWPEELDVRYQEQEKLGEGMYAETYLAKDTKYNRDVAVKVFLSAGGQLLYWGQWDTEDQKQRLFLASEECQLAVKIQHLETSVPAGRYRWMRCLKDGVQGDATEDTPSNTAAFVVYEYLGKTNLDTYVFPGGKREELNVKDLTASDWWRITKELIEGLALVEGEYVRRDIKLENVMIKKGEDGQMNVWLIDFGFVAEDGVKSLVPFFGSHPAMPPEAWEPDYVPRGSLDVWSLGCLVFKGLCGQGLWTKVWWELAYSGKVNMDVIDDEVDNKIRSGTLRPKDHCENYAGLDGGKRGLVDYVTRHMLVLDEGRRATPSAMLGTSEMKAVVTGVDTGKARAAKTQTHQQVREPRRAVASTDSKETGGEEDWIKILKDMKNGLDGQNDYLKKEYLD